MCGKKTVGLVELAGCLAKSRLKRGYKLPADESPKAAIQVDQTVRGCLSGPFHGGAPVTSSPRHKATAVGDFGTGLD